ncbi:hypothetical protein SAMN06269117_11042 [Balnearium lithotrophicum]|uniref:O-Antigen ligase n=1 Tax=Balnearium lithotrophicum TaxID=223788 RepID=A0A521C7I6_9BACT|nr:hypothetical protein SAMN06269117_11042 [Balnearium lithotrophicum]
MIRIKVKVVLYMLVSFLILSWFFNTMIIFPINYLTLTVFFYSLSLLLFIHKPFFISDIYKQIINIKLLFLLIFLVGITMIITIFTGQSSSLFLPIKAILFVLTPILFFLNYSVLYKYNLSLIIKILFILSLLFQFIFSFIIGHYDKEHGKILMKNSTIFNFSSNELSLYIIFITFTTGWIYYKYYKPNKLLLTFVYFLPLLHFSKSHLVAYLLSLLITLILQRNRLAVLFTLIFVILLKYLNNHYVEYNLLISNEQIKKLLLANHLIFSSNFQDWLSFIAKVGDRTRAYIFQTYFSNLDKCILTGLGDQANKILTGGRDYHNMFFFFTIQYGLLGFFFYFMTLVLFLFYSLKKFEYLKFISNFIIIYVILRGLFITYDPYRFTILLLFFIILEANLKYYHKCKN